VLDTYVPGFLEAVELEPSALGDGLGLYATRQYEADEVIFSWGLDDAAVLMVPETLANKFAAGAYGALAFQVLKAARSAEASAWRDWFNAGAQSPRWHPCRLMCTSPSLAQELWMSTTCGTSMSSTALDIKDDLSLLKGQSDLQEWTGMMALTMSRSLAKDPDGRPMLALGSDFLQDSDAPNVTLQIKYRTEGGIMGFGADVKKVPEALTLVATQTIYPSEELSYRYLRKDFPGKYIETFGFVPRHMRNEFGESAVELEFAPSDEEEDWHFNVKEQMLEDLGMTCDPIKFTIAGGDSLDMPEEQDLDFTEKSVMGQIAQVLRLKHVGGPESYLIEPIFIKKLWNFCAVRISKANEIAAIEEVIQECDRWLDLFKNLDGTERDDDNEVTATFAMVRKKEAQLLNTLKLNMTQALRDCKSDKSQRYWVDRRMEDLFDGVRTKSLTDRGQIDQDF